MTATGAPPDVQSLLAGLVAMEAEHDFFSLRMRGRRFWDYLRYAVAYAGLEQTAVYEEPSRVLTGSRAPDDLWSGFAHLAATAFRRPAPCAWLVINYSRKSQIDGKEVNIHTYPLIKHFSAAHRVLLVDPQPVSVPVEGLYPCEVLRSRPWHLVDRVRSSATRFTAAERRVLTDISEVLAQRMGVTLDLVALARAHFLFQSRRRAWYGRLLAATRPRVILYCDDGHQKGLIEAAADEGIPTVDLQHSLISPLNILYLYPDSLSEPLPTISDHIFTFGSFWDSQYRLPAARTAVGFPYFEQQRDEALAQAPKNRDRGIIVIGMTFPREATAGVALQLARQLPGHTVYYKLRHEEYENWRDRYSPEFAAQPNLVVIDSNDVPLYQWFARCAYQVGINSTAICEGLGFGLTTFILKVGWYKEMEYFYRHGHMFLVEQADEIVETIRSGASPVSPIGLESLFRPNALANTGRAIADVIDSASRRAH